MFKAREHSVKNRNRPGLCCYKWAAIPVPLVIGNDPWRIGMLASQAENQQIA
jgi:hypothetical protein